MEGLINDEYLGKRSMLSGEDLKVLDFDLQKKIFLTTREVIAHVWGRFGVKYSRGGITELLHRLGYSFKKPKGVPGKARREEQERFIKEYEELRSQGSPIYFADATHPRFNTDLNYGWIKRGMDFEVRMSSGKKNLNINGAIEIKMLDVLTRSYKSINKDSICHFLKALRKRHDRGERINLIFDNAGSNKARKVRELARRLNIRIIYLPPYSPNLNPIERLWKFMKRKALPNEYCQDYNSWRNSIMGFFRGIRKYRPELRTLITDHFRLVGT